MDLASSALEMVTSTAQKGTDAMVTITSTVKDGAKSIKKLPTTIDGALKEGASTIVQMPSNLQESVSNFLPKMEEASSRSGPRIPKPGDELFDAAEEFHEERSVEECFENQKRGNDGKWRPPRAAKGDPAPYSDRSHSSGFDTLNALPIQPGWEWYDSAWKLDPFHQLNCGSDGWLYATDFHSLRRNLIEGNTVGGGSDKELDTSVFQVRWRRWVRRRERGRLIMEDVDRGSIRSRNSSLSSRGSPSYRNSIEKQERRNRQFQGENLPTGRTGGDNRDDRRPGGLAQEVEEKNIVCEGWLRFPLKGARSQSTWAQTRALLIRTSDFGVGTLVLGEDQGCNGSFLVEMKRCIEGGSDECKDGIEGLHVTSKPKLSDNTWKTMSDMQRRSCFGVGSRRPGKEAHAFRALSEADAQRWILALESLEAEDKRPGNLLIEVRSLKGLPLDKPQLSGGVYATLRVTTGTGPVNKSTSVASIRTDTAEASGEDCSWTREKLIFKDVHNDNTEVTAVVAYAGLLTNLGVFDRAIGQVQFRLKDFNKRDELDDQDGASKWYLRGGQVESYGRRDAKPQGRLGAPSASTLQVAHPMEAIVDSELMMKVTWIKPDEEHIMEHHMSLTSSASQRRVETDTALQSYLDFADEQKKDGPGRKHQKGLRFYVPGFRRSAPSMPRPSSGKDRRSLLHGAGPSNESTPEVTIGGKHLAVAAASGLMYDGHLGTYREIRPDDSMPSADPLLQGLSEVLEQTQLKRAPTGEYQLRVHVIEARGLVGRDLNGLCDPKVVVKCFGQQGSTQAKTKQTSPVWDENLFIGAKDVDDARLEREVVEISVLDVDMFGEELVGSYSLDASFLYHHNAQHRIHRKWLVLTAPHDARAGGFFSEEGKEGAQGYLKVSIALIGPGEEGIALGETPEEMKAAESKESKLNQLALWEEKRVKLRSFFRSSSSSMTRGATRLPGVVADEEDLLPRDAAILRAPTALIRRKMVFLRVGVHRGVGLPDLDVNLFGKIKGGLVDAKVRIEFAGNTAETAVIKSNNPNWEQEFWMPVLVPCAGQQVRVTLLDDDNLVDDEEIGQIIINFEDILNDRAAKIGWHHVYGLGEIAYRQLHASINPLKIGDGVFDPISKIAHQRSRSHLRQYNRAYSSEWKGKILLGLNVLDPTVTQGPAKTTGGIFQLTRDHKTQPILPERVLQRRLEPLADEDHMGIETQGYELRGIVLEGCNIGMPAEVCVIELVIEEHAYHSSPPVERAGIMTWLNDESVHGANPFAIADDLHHDLTVAAPLPPGELRKANNRPLDLPPASRRARLPTAFVYVKNKNSGERTCFTTIRCEDLLARGLGFAPTWLNLVPTSPQPIQPGTPPPAILISIGLGTEPMTSDRDRYPWPPVPMPVRTHLAAFELRAYLYQARQLPARADSGLLDPYVVMSIAGIRAKNSKGHSRSEIARGTKDPLWYEKLYQTERLSDACRALLRLTFDVSHMCVQVRDTQLASVVTAH